VITSRTVKIIHPKVNQEKLLSTDCLTLLNI
jgi:hypothetical protein